MDAFYVLLILVAGACRAGAGRHKFLIVAPVGRERHSGGFDFICSRHAGALDRCARAPYSVARYWESRASALVAMDRRTHGSLLSGILG